MYCSSYCGGKAGCIKRRKYSDPNNVQKTCPICGNKFICNYQQKYCCKKCQDEIENRKARELHIQQRNKEFNENAIEGYDYVVCPICGEKFKQITIVHFRTHGIRNMEEVLEKHLKQVILILILYLIMIQKMKLYINFLEKEFIEDYINHQMDNI